MLLNAFSLNMLDTTEAVRVVTRPVSAEEARQHVARFGSAVGHADTARVLSVMLGTAVAENRVSLPPSARGRHVVAQYTGPRLPEGATTLPEGAEVRFLSVEWWPEALGD